jgi:undecaprenyl diphosphate synthase
MDGNGRWAKARGLARNDGHRAGYENIERVLEAVAAAGVSYLTIFSFSNENWERPDDEVNGLLDILALGLREQVSRLDANGVRIVHIGRDDRLPATLRKEVRAAVRKTARNSGLTLCVAFDYGGRQDIVQAVRRVVADGIAAGEVTEEAISSRLYTGEIPDPDLVIRTGGEFRISNFLLWQSAYAEFYSTQCNWPDFDAAEIENALAAYRSRERRFGRVTPPAERAG